MTRIDPAIEIAAMQLLEAALQLASGVRTNYINEQSALPERVRARALELLKSDSSFSRKMQTGGAVSLSVEADDPEQIGSYRVIRCLGKGGMGAVYLGERLAGDFDHQVAIKVIKTGLFSETLIERFRRERQTLAQLNHPHIARLYDGGETVEGAPYLVMEYVPGQTLSDWAEKEHADLATRIEIFLQICEGVEFAHQNLVIHRDLTPSNILVTHNSNVKLIDFGIARPQIEPEDGSSGSTFSGLSLTPGFAAPERLAGVATNTLVDIYSLGKILRMMLGDKRPAELAAIAEQAQSPDPADRFPTVSALKEAVIDWRERRPVSAYSNSTWYRFRKFVDRERVIVSAAAAISVALVGGLVATGWAYKSAQRERTNAELRFAETRNLSNYMIDTVVSDLEAIPGTMAVRRNIAERGRRALVRLSAVPDAPSELIAETATAYRRIGETLASPDFDRAGSTDSAISALARSEAMHRQLVRAYPERADYRLALAQAITAHAFRLTVLKNDTKSATAKLGESEAILAKLPQAGNDVRLARLSAASARAGIHNVTSDYALTYNHIDKSVAFARTIQPRTLNEKFAIASALNGLLVYRGDALWYERDDKEAALAAYRESLKPLERPEFASDIRVIKMRVFGASNLASTLFALGRTQEALQISREGIELAKRLRLFDDSIRSLQLEAAIHGEYSLELYALGEMQEGDAQAQITLGIRRELARRMPESYEAQRLIPVAQRPLGEALEDLRKLNRACQYYRQALDEWARIGRSKHKVSNFDQLNEVDWLKKRIGRCT